MNDWRQPQPGDVAAWRCSTCGINWFDAPVFQRCQSCGGLCSRIGEHVNNVLSNRESIQKANAFAQERDESEKRARRQAALDQATQERVASAAVAALHYDADNEWATHTPETLAEWAGEAAC